MAAIKQRKTKYSVIYWYVNEQGERKRKWDTVDTIGEAKSRKVFVELYRRNTDRPSFLTRRRIFKE